MFIEVCQDLISTWSGFNKSKNIHREFLYFYLLFLLCYQIDASCESLETHKKERYFSFYHLLRGYKDNFRRVVFSLHSCF